MLQPAILRHKLKNLYNTSCAVNDMVEYVSFSKAISSFPHPYIYYVRYNFLLAYARLPPPLLPRLLNLLMLRKSVEVAFVSIKYWYAFGSGEREGGSREEESNTEPTAKAKY